MSSRPTEPPSSTAFAARIGGAARGALIVMCALPLVVGAAACAAGGTVYDNPPIPDDAPHVVIETDLGDIVVGLYDQQAPITVQNFLCREAPDEERMRLIGKTMKFLEHVVRNEDYFTGKRIQQALKSGAKDACLFGRNEAGGQRFHHWVDALVATDDAGLADLFHRGIPDLAIRDGDRRPRLAD